MIPFFKYQGTGNDFIIIDQTRHEYIQPSNVQQIKKMCDRHFGIGADGLMFIKKSDQFDFEMVYFNADGRESTMCGNGGRCIVACAFKLGLCAQNVTFRAVDGIHYATVINWRNSQNECLIKLSMNDVKSIEEYLSNGQFILNTGSPHFVAEFPDIENGFVPLAREIRYSDRFKEQGININFYTLKNILSPDINIRTYERGVEDETLSCGTGVTATALVIHKVHKINSPIRIHTKGGDLTVNFNYIGNDQYTDIFLEGQATMVFEGAYPAI